MVAACSKTDDLDIRPIEIPERDRRYIEYLISEEFKKAESEFWSPPGIGFYHFVRKA